MRSLKNEFYESLRILTRIPRFLTREFTQISRVNSPKVHDVSHA